MNQGTYYLYEYQNELPLRCAGFIRVTEHYHSCILQIHAKSACASDGESFELCAFILTGNGLSAAPVGTLACRRSEISARLSVPERLFPDGCTLSGLDGFVIRRPGSAASFSGRSVFWAAADPLPPAEVFSSPSAVPEIPPSSEDIPAPPPDIPPASEDIPAQPADVPPVSEDTPAQPADVPPVSEDIPAEPAVPDEPGGDIESAEKKSEIQARKIKRSDLTLLPRRFWPLANNSFLLHGYHNYNHLLLLEDDGRLWLGVPGIYDPREARAADLFGFPLFTREGAAALDLYENEYSTDKNFGHWCRCVR